MNTTSFNGEQESMVREIRSPRGDLISLNVPLFLRDNVIVILLMIAAAIISYTLFIHQSLRLDEAQTLWQVGRDPLGILHAVGKDVHVPLYHFSIYFWQILFGDGIGAGRAFSILMFTLSIPLVVLLGREVYASKSVALFAATLFTLSPFMNWYGSTIRMYTLLVAITILNQYFFVRIRKGTGALSWWGYGATAIAGMYTHYYFGLVLLSQAVFYILYRAHFPAGSFKRFALVAGAVLLAFLPWAAYVVYLGEVGNSEPLLLRPGIIEVFNTFSYFLFGEQSDPINSFAVALWPLIMLGWFFSLQKTKTTNPDTAYLLFSVVFAVGLTFLVSLAVKPVYLQRYLIFALPAFCLGVSAMTQSYARPARVIVGVCLVVAMTAALFTESLRADTPVKENYAAAASYLAEYANPRDVIILSAPFTIYPLDYYYQGPVAVRTLPIWNRYAPGPIPAFTAATLPDQVREVAGKHERMWLLLSYDQGYEKDVRDYFDTHYQRLETHTLSPGLTLSLYRIRYDVASSASLDQPRSVR